MKLVVVESPAKAKTINKYLGNDYKVVASFGHVRDLPAKDGSVRPEEDFSMSWEVDSRGKKHMKEIADELKKADSLYLATDPDREGEAISWHIIDELAGRKALNSKQVNRVVFHEITKQAVIEAFNHPRDLNSELVEAYLARRALDYLVGFTLSPVLWRKLPGSRSAGRVQSVALRMICERESEIEDFKPQEYWSIIATFANQKNAKFEARLTSFDGKKIEKFTLNSEDSALSVKNQIEKITEFYVASVEQKRVKKNPSAPFITSTLQQEASRKLGFGATKTMKVAQSLYEGTDLRGETVGLITYMRTDGVTLSEGAIQQARSVVEKLYGKDYLPDAPRRFKSKVKNAQEAHEAIRPTDMSRKPADIKTFVTSDELRLYELIWKRTLASQMAQALFDQVGVNIATKDDQAIFRATGSTLAFEGFLKVYEEGRDEVEKENADGAILPPLERGENVSKKAIAANQHFTQPPPRYSEASLVKKMEELGIGRPSTYASILHVLQDRDYVRLEKKQFIPEDRGRLVTGFLTHFFERYVQYGFTADLEAKLDDISSGNTFWKDVLRQFWESFKTSVDETKDLKISDVIEVLDEDLGPHLFPTDPEHPDKDLRACPACATGRLGLKLGKTGGFIGCSNYPECTYTRALGAANAEEGGDAGVEAFPRYLGRDSDSGLDVSLRKGPFGMYVQLGEADPKDKKNKPKRASLPKGMPTEEITLEKALKLLSLPRVIGIHEGEEIKAGIGRFGPYVNRGRSFKSIPADEDVLNIGLNRAVALLAEEKKPSSTEIKSLGEHPQDKKPVTIYEGRYGPYIKHGKLNATIPKGQNPQDINLEEALGLLEKQAAKKSGSKKTAKTSRTTKAASTTKTTKTAVKKKTSKG